MLLTAKAQAQIDSDPNAAKTAALEANRLRPDFAPAAVIAAKLLFRQNDVRKGAKILEAAWKAEPHPEIAELYTHARPGDAVLDRLNRAKKLQEMKKNHAESSLAVARADAKAGKMRILRAHEALSAISAGNRDKFQAVVESLRGESGAVTADPPGTRCR